MRILVRFITRTAEGATKRRDKVFDTGTLTLGRGTDQTLHLRHPSVALKHATLVDRDGRLVLNTLNITGVVVNNHTCRNAVLKAADRIRIGDNVLTVIEPPAGFDFALTFELDPDVSASEAVPAVYQTRLAETAMRPRRWAWISVIAVLAAGLLLPSLVLVSQDAAELLRDTPLPDDGWWLSGPLHNAHRSIGEDCLACHTPFKRTPDRLCMECHGDVQKHIADTDSAGARVLSERRCARCHKEHNEPSSLVRRDQIVCTDCHANIGEYAVDTDLRNVDGFVAGHAGFYVSMLVPEQNGNQWKTVRVALDDAATREQSGLKFPHAKHLAAEGIKGADGDVVLQCTDCHLPQAGGAVMRAVDMQRDCQGCHRLDFEPDDPQRQVPHAQTDIVLNDMQEYYAWRYLYGMEDTLALGIDPDMFRRPGKIGDRGAREKLTRAAAVKALEVAGELINTRACANCHETRTTDAEPGTAVVPVRLTERWLPKGDFNHAGHIIFDCAECHAADTSEDSSDVLIPDVDTCGDCHAGTDVAGKVTTACLDCHGFHRRGAGEWHR